MLTVREFVAQLDQDTTIALVNAIGSGLHDARKAAECISRSGPQAENPVQLAAYLTRAIASLQEAQTIVQQHG